MIDNPTEWFQIKVVELESDLKKKTALCDMKSMVLNSEKRILNEIVHNVSLNPVFECLSTTDSQEIESACTVLHELLSQMTADELLESYGDLLHRSLAHPANEAKELALKLLEKAVNERILDTLLKKHISLLVNAAECLASSERRTAQGAISLFIKLGGYKQGINILYSEAVLTKLKEVMTVNDTSRFRVYEIVVAISSLSAENLSASVASGLMGSLVSEVSSSDILIQLNTLEILSNLALSNHGLSYLQECKVIQNLADKLLKLNEEPLSLVLLPGLFEFFGNLCSLQPEYFSHEYPQVINLLFNSLDTNDEVLLGVIITTVGKIGSTSDGRLVLSKHERLTKSFLRKVGLILRTKSDSAITAMNSLCELLKDINGDTNLNTLTKMWFDSVGPDALNNIINLTKLPFIEFRLAALALLKAITTQEWGTERLSNYPGMIEFLTDRSTEFTKDCKQIKFEIVCNMVQSQNIAITVTPEVLLTLKEFVKEGPFYVPTQVEMATEGAM